MLSKNFTASPSSSRRESCPQQHVIDLAVLCFCWKRAVASAKNRESLKEQSIPGITQGFASPSLFFFFTFRSESQYTWWAQLSPLGETNYTVAVLTSEMWLNSDESAIKLHLWSQWTYFSGAVKCYFFRCKASGLGNLRCYRESHGSHGCASHLQPRGCRLHLQPCWLLTYLTRAQRGGPRRLYHRRISASLCCHMI